MSLKESQFSVRREIIKEIIRKEAVQESTVRESGEVERSMSYGQIQGCAEESEKRILAVTVGVGSENL